MHAPKIPNILVHAGHNINSGAATADVIRAGPRACRWGSRRVYPGVPELTSPMVRTARRGDCAGSERDWAQLKGKKKNKVVEVNSLPPRSEIFCRRVVLEPDQSQFNCFLNQEKMCISAGQGHGSDNVPSFPPQMCAQCRPRFVLSRGYKP